MTGWTNNWLAGESRADAAFGVSTAAGMAGPLRRGHRVRLLVLHRACALAAGQEHQDVAGEHPDLELAVGGSGAVENVSAASGFVRTGRSVAEGDGYRPLSARAASAGPASRHRR